MRFATKMVKYWIKNIFGNTEGLLSKLDTGSVHHKRNQMMLKVLSSPVSFCQKRNIFIFNPLRG